MTKKGSFSEGILRYIKRRKTDMDLFLMRHAVAAARAIGADDFQRPLTKEGQRDQRLVAGALVPLLWPLEHLFSSPLLRALQTADIVAETLGFPGEVEATTVLGQDCTVEGVLNLLHGYPRQARILCVGHEPNMSRLSAVFLDGEGRSAIAFQPGSIIALTFPEHASPARGILRFFLRPAELLQLTGKTET
jgi:phosphohistidine phosphatase